MTHLVKSALLPEAICRRDDGSEVAEWPAGTPTAGGRAGPGASKAILDRLTAATSSLGGSGSYRGWAHPERQPAGHLCPLTSILAGRTGEAVSATARLRTRTLCHQGPSRQVPPCSLLLLDGRRPGGFRKPRVVVLGP